MAQGYPLIALKRLATRSIGPPLLTIPAIMLAIAQQPMMPAIMATAVIPVLDISVLTLVAAVVAARLLFMPVVFFMTRSKEGCFGTVTEQLLVLWLFCYDSVHSFCLDE